VLKSGPELVVEIRSPSNRRTKELQKRRVYFLSGTLVVWDVDPVAHKIWVFEAENPQQAQEYNATDIITCERLLPGWRRQVADFFTKELSVEQVVGQVAEEWRAESHEQGRAEGQTVGELKALRDVLLRQARLKFGAENLPGDLEARLSRCTVEELTNLADGVAIVSTLEQWLVAFPE
jgi:hypothetical protein